MIFSILQMKQNQILVIEKSNFSFFLSVLLNVVKGVESFQTSMSFKKWILFGIGSFMTGALVEFLMIKTNYCQSSGSFTCSLVMF